VEVPQSVGPRSVLVLPASGRALARRLESAVPARHPPARTSRCGQRPLGVLPWSPLHAHAWTRESAHRELEGKWDLSTMTPGATADLSGTAFSIRCIPDKGAGAAKLLLSIYPGPRRRQLGTRGIRISPARPA